MGKTPTGGDSRGWSRKLSPVTLMISYEQLEIWTFDAVAIRMGGGSGRTWKPQALVASARKYASSGRARAKPMEHNARMPAGELCSKCGLCETSFVHHVRDACAFIDAGMSKAQTLEQPVHGRSRLERSEHELLWGVTLEQTIARNRVSLPTSEGEARKQWTGIVSAIAASMLRNGDVDAVACVASDEADPRLPTPILATSEEEVLSSAGVKPVLAPSARVLDEAERRGVRSLLFIGVGCAVQALRAVQHDLNVDSVFVLGLHCADNGTTAGFSKFINATSAEPSSVVAYEFAADFQVHFKHRDSNGHLWYETIPYFSLPANDLSDVIASPCKTCADYVNSLADCSVGYMAARPHASVPMHQHPQVITVRNERGQTMLNRIRHQLQTSDMESGGLLPKSWLVKQTLLGDEAAVSDGRQAVMPVAIGKIVAKLLTLLGPVGKSFGEYSIEYHLLRNWIFTVRKLGPERARQHFPQFAQTIVSRYQNLLSRIFSS